MHKFNRDVLRQTTPERQKPPDYVHKGLFCEGKNSLGERFSCAQLIVDESVAEWKWSSLGSQLTVAFAKFEKLSWRFYN